MNKSNFIHFSLKTGLLLIEEYETHSHKDLEQSKDALFFFYHFLKIYLFLAALGLCCCTTRAFSSCGEQGLLFVAVRGLLIVVASPNAEHGLQTRRLSSCGSRAQLLRGMWDLPRPGLEPVSPALAGGFITTAPPGKPKVALLTGYCLTV